MSTVYRIIAFPTTGEDRTQPLTWASTQHVFGVPVGPDGSWGTGYDNWGDPSLNLDGGGNTLSGYWGWMNGPTAQSEQIPASSVSTLQGFANVTVVSTTR